MSFGPNPWLQQHWDARAAANFMAGGAGSGVIVAAALAGGPRWSFLLGAALVASGLGAVALEIGRPLRSLNVYFNPRTSWMSREAIAALLLFACVAAVWADLPLARTAATLAALAFVYCQGRILRASKGIPAWREPRIVPLIIATGLAEGSGLWLLVIGSDAGWPAWLLCAGALLARWVLWRAWRARLSTVPRALAVIDRAGRLHRAGTALALAALALALFVPAGAAQSWALAAAGSAALAAGLWFKFTLVTRAAFNQGFALTQLPVRGVRRTR